VQVNFLGFPGTMGASYVDYIIADPIVIPDGDLQHYCESVVHIPNGYLPTDSARRISDRKSSRTGAGLPERGFVFCSFNNSYKLSPGIFDVWMRLLGAVDGSVLWLPQVNAAAVRNLRREAGRRGVSEQRLVFAPFVSADDDHLARLGLADLFLDTVPYNAHSTAIDALWAGVPVLTIRGAAFAGRVAASVLTAMGLPELIASSLADYESLAVKLAREPHTLSAIKAKLARDRETSALFDTPRYTLDLESAYTQMWHRHRNGESPACFSVSSMS
jgi:predicted O-linked N-acetylglucosamine transferase (SPINDLY family)